jgi:hypothetical protein
MPVGVLVEQLLISILEDPKRGFRASSEMEFREFF